MRVEAITVMINTGMWLRPGRLMNAKLITDMALLE